MRCYSIDESRYPLVVVTARGEIPLDDFGKAAWFKQHERLMKENVAGTAVVFHSPLFRFMLTSIMLIVPIPVPFSTRGLLEEGVAWAEKQLDRRWGIKIAG